MSEVVVIGDDAGGRPGYVGAEIERSGGRLHLLDRDALSTYAQACEIVGGTPDLVFLLGSQRSAWDDEKHAGAIAAETAFLHEAAHAGVPVLGICYGAQISSRAFGGTVGRAPMPEVGLVEVESLDPDLCPSGPWIEFHGDTFTPPPGATITGRTAAGPQGFTWEGDDARPGARVLAWQFHPEATPDVLDFWLSRPGARDFAEAAGCDASATQARVRDLAPDLEARASALTRAALTWLRVGRRE